MSTRAGPRHGGGQQTGAVGAAVGPLGTSVSTNSVGGGSGGGDTMYYRIMDPTRHTSRRALMDHLDSSPALQVLVPVLIVASFAVRIWSIIVVITRVKLQANVVLVGGKEYEVFEQWLIDYSFPQMVHDFWNAGAYLVAFLIIGGSAVLPIFKHLALLVSWFWPMSRAQERRRGQVLFALDQVGRMSLIDLFLLGYVVCIFYTDARLEVLGTGLHISMTAEPVKGIFSGVAGTLFVQCLSHAVLLIHDSQRSSHDTEITVATGPPVASLLQRVRYSTTMRQSTKSLVLLGHSLLFVAAFVVSGVALSKDIVSFELQGLLGDVVDEPPRKFGLLTLPKTMPQDTDEVGGAEVLMVLYVLLTIALPATLFGLALALWIIPMKVHIQRWWLAMLPFLLSWSTLDVFLLTTFASYLEMHLIAVFTIEDRYGTLCKAQQVLTRLPCINLGHELEDGASWLLAAIVLLAAVNLVTLALGGKLFETLRDEDEDESQSQLDASG